MHNGDHFTTNMWSDGFTLNVGPASTVTNNLVRPLSELSWLRRR